MTGFWNFRGAGRLVFGWGVSGRIAEALGASSPLTIVLVTDPPLVETGAVDDVAERLRDAGHAVTIFDGGEPEPHTDLALEVAETARAVGANVFLGLGGGSNLDLAKIASVLVRHGGRPADYFGFDKVPGPVFPIVAVPTTAGTGSEVSHSAVLTATDPAGGPGLKVSTLSEHLRPALAVVDPALTVTCPPRVTAESGADALVHAVEAFTATTAADLAAESLSSLAYQGKNPLADGLAQSAIAAIGRSLVRAIEQPTDPAARTDMVLAATQAGLAFSNAGVALVHALEYPLGGAGYCGHGLGNALLLPHVMRFLIPVRASEFAIVGRLLRGEGTDADTRTDPVAEAQAAVETVEALLQAAGIPPRLRDLGVPEAELPTLAQSAIGIERLIRLTPRPVTAADATAIYQAAW